MNLFTKQKGSHRERKKKKLTVTKGESGWEGDKVRVWD